MTERSWLAGFLREAEEQARRRGDSRVAAEHLALTLARPGADDGLLTALGVEALDWRDQIVMVTGWQEGARAAREGRPAGALADSISDLRFRGAVDVGSEVSHILTLATVEADANDSAVGPVHLLVGLLMEAENIGAATGRWLGMTPGRVRAAAGLRNERRIVAGGAPAVQVRRGATAGPVVLCGGGADVGLLTEVVTLARRGCRSGPRAVLVDLGWHTRRPSPSERRLELERLAWAGAVEAVDSRLTERSDAESAEACRRLATADLVWLTGGDPAVVYDRLWATPALAAIKKANARGAVVGGVSAGATVWGAGTLSDFGSLGDPEPFSLFGWLDDLLVFCHYGPSRERAFRERVAAFPGCRGLAIAHGGAVAVDSGGGSRLRVLRRGAGGVDHALLSAPDQALSPIRPA